MTDPNADKTQTKRLSNIIFGGPMMIKFGMKGKIGGLSRGIALYKAPSVFRDSLDAFRAAEVERANLGRTMPFWEDPEIARDQAFRVFSFGVLAPACLVAAAAPQYLEHKYVRSLALIVGVITIAYNWDGYAKAAEEAKKQVTALLEEENFSVG